MARRLDTETVLNGPRFADALSEGSRIAYKGVHKPVEGTILTVVREAAAAAESAADARCGSGFCSGSCRPRCWRSCGQHTKPLASAGPVREVDSGGKGLFFILEGMQRSLLGEAVDSEPTPEQLRLFQRSKRDDCQRAIGFCQCLNTALTCSFSWRVSILI